VTYRFVDDVATADCAVEVVGGSLEEVFADAGRALISRMTDIQAVNSEKRWEIELSKGSLLELFYAWLSELVYIKDTENVLFSDFEIQSIDADSPSTLRAEAVGEAIDHSRHDIAVDVKAVTMHKFEITKSAVGWKAFIVFDL